MQERLTVVRNLKHNYFKIKLSRYTGFNPV